MAKATVQAGGNKAKATPVKENKDLVKVTDQEVADKLINSGVQPHQYKHPEGGNREYHFHRKEAEAVGIKIG